MRFWVGEDASNVRTQFAVIALITQCNRNLYQNHRRHYDNSNYRHLSAPDVIKANENERKSRMEISRMQVDCVETVLEYFVNCENWEMFIYVVQSAKTHSQKQNKKITFVIWMSH